MPINVTCSECAYRFLVADEFAGQSGRCPECDAVIMVPGAAESVKPEPPREPDPYRTRRPSPIDDHDDHDEVRPRRSQRREEEFEAVNDKAGDELRQSRRAADLESRAGKWTRVSAGLRNLIIATILFAMYGISNAAINLIKGMPDDDDVNQDPGEIAIRIGGLFVLGLATIFWAWGRMLCAKVPYLAAQSIAKTTAVLAVITATVSILSFIFLAVSVVIVQNNMAAGMSFMMIGGCGIILVMLGFFIAELLGILSQIRMAPAFQNSSFGGASKFLLTIFIVILTGSLVGCCGLIGFLSVELQQKQQAMVQNQQNAPKGNQPVPKDAPAKKAKRPPPFAPPPNGQPQPEFDPADYPNLFLGVWITFLLTTILYSLASIITFQTGRNAIRREVAKLVGDPDDPHDRPNRDDY